ncbi:MAG: hypothetical protein NUK62_05905 [Tenericutes bacterium]|nr:hypothetical protein [Mycoplasmatota bacterium]
MKLIKNKKGMGLATVLGIVAFVLGTTATLLTYVFFQARLIQTSIETTESYINAVQKVETTLNIIARDQTLDESYLNALELYMGVSIEPYGDNLWSVTSSINERDLVTSYITGSTSVVNTYETIFEKTGEEPDFYLSPLITPTSLLTAYLVNYFEINFFESTMDSSLVSFQEVIDFIKQLSDNNEGFDIVSRTTLTNQSNPTVLSHWLIEGDVSITGGKNLTIPNGLLLIIDGNLNLSAGSKLYGNVVVNGTVEYGSQGKKVQGLEGTIYANGDVVFSKNMTLGTYERPSFVFSEQDIILDNNTSGIAYFLSQNFTAQQGNIYITGGVYTVYNSTLQNDVEEYPDLDQELFYEYAIPTTIYVESDSNGEIGSGGFKFTYPKLSS